MTLAASFTALGEKIAALEHRFDDLLWAVIQAQPKAEPGHALVDHYDRATSDVLGCVKEAHAAVAEGRQAALGQPDLATARQALTICQERLHQVLGHVYGDLLSLEWNDALKNLARERGGEWATWVYGVQDALSPCSQPLHEATQALLPCWLALTEWAGALSAIVHTSGPEKNAVSRQRKRPRRTA